MNELFNHEGAVVQALPQRSRGCVVDTERTACLVLSASADRRQMLSEAVRCAGWEAIVCENAESAFEVQARSVFRLAVIDLQDSGGMSSGFRKASENLVASQKSLTVFCGQEADVQEEIWARQLGCWLYLPGVSSTCAQVITALCREARSAADAVAHA